MSDQIIEAARNRLRLAFPDWLDATGDPTPTPDDDLPSYAITLSFSGSEPLGMGDPRHIREGDLVLTLKIKSGAQDYQGETDIHVQAKAFKDVILGGERCLGGVVWDLEPQGFDPDHDAGESRISEGDLTFGIKVID